MAIDLPDDWPNRAWSEDAPLAHLETINKDAPDGTEPTRWQVANWSSTREIRSSALPGQIRHSSGLSIGTAKAVLKRENNDYPWKQRLVYELTGQDAQILLAPAGQTEIPTGQFRVAEVSGDITSLAVQADLDEKQIEGTDSSPGVLGEQIVSQQQIDDTYFDPIWLIEQLARQMGYGVRVEPGGTLPDGSMYAPLLDIPYQGSLVPAHPVGVNFSEFVGDEGHFETMDKGLIAGQPNPYEEGIVALAPRPGNSRVYLEYYLRTQITSRFTITADTIGNFEINWNGDGVPGVLAVEVDTFLDPNPDLLILRLSSSGSNGSPNSSSSLNTSQSVPQDRPFGIQIEVEVTQTGETWTSARARIRRSADASWSGWLNHAMTNVLNVEAPYSVQIQTRGSLFEDSDGRLARLSVSPTVSPSQQDALLRATQGATGRISLEPLVGTDVSPWLDPDLTVWGTMQAIVEAWQGALITDVYGNLHVLNRYSLTGVQTGAEARVDVGMRFEDVPWAMNHTDQADRLVVRYRPAVERIWDGAPNKVDIVWEAGDVIPVAGGTFREVFFTLDYIYPVDLQQIPFVRKDQPDAAAGRLHEWDAWRYSNGTGDHIDANSQIAMRVDRVTSSTWKIRIENRTAFPWFYMVDETGAPWLKIRSTWYFDQTQEAALERGLPAGQAKNALEIDLGHYVQNAEDANALADFIWGRVRQRSWRAATVNTVPDFRVDLGDVLELVHTRTQMRSNALVTKVELLGEPGQVTQRIDLVLIPPTWEDFDEAWDGVGDTNTRINPITNPSVENNANGWESNSAFGGYDVAAFARSLEQAWVGSASLKVTAPAPVAGSTWANFTAMPTIPGRTYTYSAYVYSETEATFYADAVFINQGPDVVVPPGVWTRVSTIFVANSNQAFCGVGIDGAPQGFVYYVDGALLEQKSSVGSYFDGSTPDTSEYSYAWTGSAHASTSTATPVATAGDTWNDFDALWVSYTWEDFDRTPTATTVAEIEEAL